jgi:hypothetical protein
MSQKLIQRGRALARSHLLRGNLKATLFVESQTGIHSVPLEDTPPDLWQSLARKTVARLSGTAVALACAVEELPGMPSAVMVLHGEAGSRVASFLPYTADQAGIRAGPGWVTFHNHVDLEHLLDGIVGGAEA